MPELHNPGTLTGTKVEQLNRGHRIPEGWKPYRWNGDPAERFIPPLNPNEPEDKQPKPRPRKPCPSYAAYQRGCRCDGCIKKKQEASKDYEDKRKARRAADAKRRAEMKREREAK